MTIDEPTTTEATESEPTLARRGLMLGAGAAALAAGTLAAHLWCAPWHEPTRQCPRARTRRPQPHSDQLRPKRVSPVASTIGSPPISGYTYRHVSWLDFQPESGPATRTYGGQGATPAEPRPICGRPWRSRPGRWSGTSSGTPTTTAVPRCPAGPVVGRPAPAPCSAPWPTPPSPRPGRCRRDGPRCRWPTTDPIRSGPRSRSA